MVAAWRGSLDIVTLLVGKEAGLRDGRGATALTCSIDRKWKIAAFLSAFEAGIAQCSTSRHTDFVRVEKTAGVLLRGRGLLKNLVSWEEMSDPVKKQI